MYVVARILQASSGKSSKQQQEQTSPNHVQALISCPVRIRTELISLGSTTGEVSDDDL